MKRIENIDVRSTDDLKNLIIEVQKDFFVK